MCACQLGSDETMAIGGSAGEAKPPRRSKPLPARRTLLPPEDVEPRRIRS